MRLAHVEGFLDSKHCLTSNRIMHGIEGYGKGINIVNFIYGKGSSLMDSIL